MLQTFYRHWLHSFQGIPREIWLLSLVNFINRCGGMVLIFFSVYLTKHLGFGIKEAGYVMTCFGIGALAGIGLGGKITDKLGYYPVQLVSLTTNGVLLLIMLRIESFWAMCCMAFTLSVSSDAFRPANQVAIGLHSTPETRTRSISLMRLAYNLGFTIAPALGGIIAAHFGWHWLFWADGLTCLGAAFALWLLLRPAKKTADLTTDSPNITTPAYSPPYRNRIFMVFSVCTFLSAMAFMQIVWTVPVYFKDIYGWPEDKMGLVLALNGILVFIIEMPFIYAIDGRRSPLTYILLGIILYAVAYLCFLLPFGAMLASILFIIFISFGEMLAMPFSGNYAFTEASKHPNTGAYMATYGLSYSFANIFAPLLGTQIIAAYGYHWHWGITIMFALTSLIGFYLLSGKVTGKN